MSKGINLKNIWDWIRRKKEKPDLEGLERTQDNEFGIGYVGVADDPSSLYGGACPDDAWWKSQVDKAEYGGACACKDNTKRIMKLLNTYSLDMNLIESKVRKNAKKTNS